MPCLWRRIIPAYAGSTLGRRLPVAGFEGSSPHTRGAHRRHPHPQTPRRIIPAYAGSTRSTVTRSRLSADHPRIRGEHVAGIPGKIVKAGSSPHTRGARRLGLGRRQGCRIIPAYAGSTVGGLGAFPGGEGSSPHTRGAPTAIHGRRRRCRIIPAYAGSTSADRMGSHQAGDHPRIRGEHIQKQSADSTGKGSSPHTRGARPREGPGRGYQPDHPRIRGEHFPHVHTVSRDMGSSPHTRGAPYCGPHESIRYGIIPAYAGSTLGNPCNTKDRRRDYTSFPLPVTHPSGGGGS